MGEGAQIARDASEFKTWLYASLFTVVLSVAVFAIQRFAGPIFNLAFEICIFYIPTAILLIIILLHQKMALHHMRCAVKSACEKLFEDQAKRLAID